MAPAKTDTLTTMKKPHPKRLTGGKGAASSHRRYELYKLANEQIKIAFNAGCYIECVALCESIISDRIEARLQFLSRGSETPTYLNSLGPLLKQVESVEKQQHIELRDLYRAIREWSRQRNTVIHQFVKVSDANQDLDGKDRILNARTVAREGIVLMKKISSLVKKENKWPTK